jgi:exodeoxyribonuclease VII large subunit
MENPQRFLFGDDEPDAAAQPQPPEGPLSVGDLTARLKSLVEAGFARVEVEGQVSGFRPHSSGHLYFTLKDERSQIRAVMFRTDARRLTFKLEDGQHVVARGRISVYEVRGEYQIICDRLEPHGQGALQVAFEQLKRRLAAEGLFDTARKRPLPTVPRKIGIVTSRSGAALQDILRVLIARHPYAQIVVRDARVQGDGAAEDLTRALRAITAVAGVDVVIIGRGGGSIEDLWAFNDERLARAIVASRVPIISAVGHEVDFTIADFVADLRAATPSNAAELVVERADTFRDRIDRALERLTAVMRRAVDGRRERALRTVARLGSYPTRLVLQQRDCQEFVLRMRHAQLDRVARATQRFEQLRRRLEARDVRRVTAGWRLRLTAMDGRLQQTGQRHMQAADTRARELAARLHALSPLAVLGRGYAVCWNDARTSIIRSASTVAPGDAVRVTVADGELRCEVTETKGAGNGMKQP